MSTPGGRRSTAPARVRRQPLDPRAWRAIAVDAAAIVALLLVALSALAGTFDSGWFLLPVAAGALAGVGSAVLCRWRGWPAYAVVPLLLLGAALLGPPLTLRASTVPAWPAPASLAELARLSIAGWRELLTTLPPISGTGPLTALPFFLALIGGATAMIVAGRTRSPYLPLLPVLATAVLAIILGIVAVPAPTVRALLGLAVAVAWGMARRRRLIESTAGGSWQRAATAAALLAVAGGLAAAAAPVVAQVAGERDVARRHVVAPLDLVDHPSPLASFRRFRPVAKDLADVPLLQVDGAPAGTVVRLATLDSYSGAVWSAGLGMPTAAQTQAAAMQAAAGGDPEGSGSNGFLRVGARIPVSVPGDPVTATITVGAAYANNPDLGLWVPTIGRPERITFAGAPARQQHLRVNPGTGAALVTSGLQAQDRYEIAAVIPAADASPTLGSPSSPTTPASTTSVAARLVATTPAGTDRLAQLKAIAQRLRTEGAYSDGEETDGATSVPGHSIGRLQAFLSEAEPVGNDEQYAAALALAAEHLGLPARIVLGAVPEASGSVRGVDVRTWVEVEVDRGQWFSFAPETFIPPYDKKPKPRSVREEDRTHAAIVPPPNAQRPPSSLEDFALDDSTSGAQRDIIDVPWLQLPPWAVLTLKIASVPLGVLLGWTLLALGLKSGRRWLRQRRGDDDAKVGAAWRDVVDTLRDTGHGVSLALTRSEVAERVGGAAVAESASYIDRLSFGPVRSTPDDVVHAWVLSRRVRDAQSSGLSWRERWQSLATMGSFLPVFAGTRGVQPSQVQHDRVVSPTQTLITDAVPQRELPEEERVNLADDRD